uniref:ALMS motif domain-containing protein n=2 Tax=Sphaeramia orbicularis TaxID=375764 RepID=A0A673B5W7_9TELE
MQQTDLLRRRRQVSQMPPQIFQPLYKRQETREEFQREMEFAFEDMYTGERRVKGDLVVQLVPEPLPTLSTCTEDQDLDVTRDEIPPAETDTSQHDTEREVGGAEQETSAQAESVRPPPRRALKKLLDRIRSQRNQQTEHSHRFPGAVGPGIMTDQIPERDSTIDTGSLTSDERENPPPVRPDSPPASETIEPLPATDVIIPDEFTNRIQEFDEERKKRDEELEREKQKQMVLLQELEEQKVKLEQMLFEAQKEREHLKAAVTQNLPVEPEETPVHDQEDASVRRGQSSEVVPPVDEDGHTRRIREYQQRLLERNRTHQRSIEVARQRLEEYQRALRIRSNMSAVGPPGLIRPPLHWTEPSAHVSPPLDLPTIPTVPSYVYSKPQTSADVPTRDSDISAPPPHPYGLPVNSESRRLPDPVQIISDSPTNQRVDVAVQVTDRVTEHQPQQKFHKVHMTQVSTPGVPLPSTSDPIQTISDQVTVQPGSVSRGSPHTGSVSSRRDDMERQRLELREVMRRMLEQREAVALQQKQQEVDRRREEEGRWREEEDRRRQEEDRRRRHEEMETMRLQKETLQALINTDAQAPPETASEVLVPEDVNQTRLKLLASLLKAIEESNGGTLSHLEEPQEEAEAPPQQPSTSGSVTQIRFPAGPAPGAIVPPRTAKPPVTRVRLGIMEREQHELSVIQEVETPVNVSQTTGPEDDVKVLISAVGRDAQESWDSSVASVRTPMLPSRRQQTIERPPGSGMSSATPSPYMWKERLLSGAVTSPESSVSAQSIISPLSSDSGRGADYSGPAVTSYRSPQSEHRTRDPECFSSTTISTGSYITTDPEQNSDHDNAPPHGHEDKQGTGLLNVSTPSDQSSCVKDASAPGFSDVTAESLFNESSIQRIIDRYTKELNISLSTAGKTTDSEGSYTDESGSSVSQKSLIRVSQSGVGEVSTGHRSPPSDSAGTQRISQPWDTSLNPVLDHFSDVDLSQGQDSFRPLIGHLADQSSCLSVDQRDSAVKQLVGQPSAHSSMIGQLPGPTLPLSSDHGGWDSTLSHMIGRLSHHSASQWLSSGGRDLFTGHMMELEQSSMWLVEGQEERMRPLVGEPDESAVQMSGSAGERAHVDVGVSAQITVSSHPALPPESSSHSASDPRVSPHPQDQGLDLQIRPEELDSERSEVFPASDSFHPLPAEVTHNETVDPTMTFDLLGQGDASSPTDRSADSSLHSEVCDVSPDPPVEQLRAEERSRCLPDPHQSFTELQTSQCRPQDSVLMASSVDCDVEVTVLNLSHLSVCDSTSGIQLPPPPEEEQDGSDKNLDETSEQKSDLDTGVPVSEKILVTVGEKGILEQSEITLVSLTDSSLQDQDTTITEEQEATENEVDEEEEEEHQTTDTQTTESMSNRTLVASRGDQLPPVRLLDFHWGSDLQDVQQQKLMCLLQKSTARVEAIRARAAFTKTQTHLQNPPGSRRPAPVHKPDPVSKTKAGPQLKAGPKTKGGRRESGDKSTDRPGDKSTERPGDKRPERPGDKSTERPGDKSTERPGDKRPERPGDKSTERPGDKSTERPGDKRPERPGDKRPERPGDKRPERPGDKRPERPGDKRPERPGDKSTERRGFTEQTKTQTVSDSAQKKVEVRICTPERRKQDVLEMHQRTQRLYEQLEEVKHQKEARSRQEAYAKNRLKAKEFHKKTLQKLRAKQTQR